LRDLPYAHVRFCGTEGNANAITVSDFVTGKFVKDYQLENSTDPLVNLHLSSILVLGKNQQVIYNQQVPEIVDELNYEAALASLKYN
jgi:thiol peroxidase